ncbi:MAG TPA: pyridoxal-phosphate dependent enzyme [Thermoanaerobaculia bacterium]|nr:pyridoxal-phosphate dependent enzyme [Thermoanaerobaculia bacterium]
MSSSTSIVCAGCGWSAPPLDPAPFRCPNGGDDVDHVLQRRLSGTPQIVDDPNPFVRFRQLTHAWHTAMRIGMSDGEFVQLVRGLELPFGTTPCEWQPSLGVWVKDETANVAGSHKSRHLMGLMIWLLVAERIDPTLPRRPLAIASCGNAAIAAATVARAAHRALEVFIPAGTNARVVEELEDLGAYVTPCERSGDGGGDPAYLRFREAVAAGALPFTCQGNENGLVIEGGETLGWELISQCPDVERIVIQVGGGALASAVIAAFNDFVALGLIDRLPRFDTVQTTSCYPLERAYERVDDLGYARRHRSEFMWPWETEPRSVAEGILDDETYDWAAVVQGMLATGGKAIVVPEEQLIEANRAARAAGYEASETGSAGYAGVLARPSKESTVVLFTGCRRAGVPAGWPRGVPPPREASRFTASRRDDGAPSCR